MLRGKEYLKYLHIAIRGHNLSYFLQTICILESDDIPTIGIIDHHKVIAATGQVQTLSSTDICFFSISQNRFCEEWFVCFSRKINSLKIIIIIIGR